MAEAAKIPSASSSSLATSSKAAKVQPPSTETLPSLASFLNQVSAGSSSSSSLPLHAQLSLISTQLANAEDQTVRVVDASRDEIKGIIGQGAEARQDVARLEGRIAELEGSVVARDILPPALGTAFQDYVDSLYSVHQAEHLLQTLEAIQVALVAIEELEQQVAEGRLEASSYIDSLNKTRLACQPIGLVSAVTGDSASHAWLSQMAGSSRMPHGIENLQRRLQAVQKFADHSIDDGWNRAVRFSPGDQDDYWQLAVMPSVDVSSSGHTSIALSSLAESLEQKDKLSAKLVPLASSVAEQLNVSVLAEPPQRWSSDVSTDASGAQILTLQRLAGEASPGHHDDDCEVLKNVFDFIGKHIISQVPTQARATFSRALLPQIIPSVLDKLKSSLPTALNDTGAGQPSATQFLITAAQTARELHSSLVDSGLVSAGQQEDSEEEESMGNPSAILRFASSVASIFSNRLAARYRDSARQLCLMEDSKSWDTVDEQVEPAVLMPDEAVAVPDAAIDRQPPLKDVTKSPVADEWGWNDEEEDSKPVTSTARPLKTNLSRNNSTASSTRGSLADDRNGVRSASPATKPLRGGKSALGSVRVIKPKDQLGSGPLPEDEEEEDAWGLDDDAEQPATPPRPHKPSSAANIPPPSPSAGMDDAWGLEDEEVDEATQKSLESAPAAPTTPLNPSTLAQGPVEARQSSAEEPRMPSLPSTSSLPAIGSDFDEDVDEDAWGLSEAEKAERAAKRASMRAIPIGFQLPKSPEISQQRALSALTEKAEESEPAGTQPPLTPTHEVSYSLPANEDDEDLDEDAWGLSAEEQQEIREKRASRMLTGLTLPTALPTSISQSPAGEPIGDALTASNLKQAADTRFQDGNNAMTEVNGHQESAQTSLADASVASSVAAMPPSPGSEREELGSTTPHNADDLASLISEPSSGRPWQLESALPANTSEEVASDASHPPTPGTQQTDTMEDYDHAVNLQQALLETQSVTSDTSSSQHFPLESAQPQTGDLDDVASNVSFPATPKTGGTSLGRSRSRGSAEAVSSAEATERFDALSIASAPMSDGSFEGGFPLESAQPGSSSASVVSGRRVGGIDSRQASLGPPSTVASLPGTPKAESVAESGQDADWERQDEAEALVSHTPSELDSRPATPDHPPFPIHSAMPWVALRTGPPSVASAARSDVAMPPSPPPEMEDRPHTPLTFDDVPKRDDDDTEDQDGADDIRRDRSATTTAIRSPLAALESQDEPSGGATNGSSKLRDAMPSTDDAEDDDPWADLEAEPAVQSKQANVAVDSSVTQPSVAKVAPGKEEADAWSWDDSVKETAAAAAIAGGTAITAAALARNDNESQDRSVEVSASSLQPLETARKAEPTTAGNGKRMETCKISKRSRDLVELGRQSLADAINLAKAQHQAGDTPVGNPIPLLLATRDIFSLHSALLPTVHAKVLDNVPSLAMQFANDCQYLSKEIFELHEQITTNPDLAPLLQSGSREVSELDLSKEAMRHLLLGKQTFESQMATQASLLASHLHATDSFLRVYEDARFQTCSKSLNALLLHFKSLHSAWKDVLSPSSCSGALGTLLEAVCVNVSKSILQMEDIGEQEGERLAELIRLIGPLDQLFPSSSTGEESTSTIAYFVPSWLKTTGYLPEILVGSLADVEFILFQAGGLATNSQESGGCFTKEEAKRLIRATFADTTRRKELLSRVERA